MLQRHLYYRDIFGQYQGGDSETISIDAMESQHTQRTEQSQHRREEDVRYSLRDAIIPQKADLEKKAPVKVVDISTAQTGETFAQRRKKIIEGASETIARPYLNKDTNTLIFLTIKSYTHAFNNLGTIQLNAAEHLPELVENAVLTHAERSTHGSDYTDRVYTFFAAAKADRIVPAKLKVKEYSYIGQMLPQNIRDYFESNPG